MQDIKYVCPNCGYEAKVPSLCPNCQVPLVATCPVCGNPIVGEHIHAEDWAQFILYLEVIMADKKVVVYSTPTWPYCKRAKEYLSRKDIAYVDYNVAGDREKAKEMIQKSGQMGVPVITIDDEVMVGFNQSLLDQKLS